MRKHLILMIAVAGIAGAANAQTAVTSAVTPKTPVAHASESPGTARVETWTKKQWNAAQKEWARDKAKWSNCQKQSGEKHLGGRKSWSFLYTCMTG
jgi:hypothetical protein